MIDNYVKRRIGAGWMKWKLTKDSFHSHRGLRQGDPMSPFLFLLAMEGLNHIVRIANANRWVKGLSAQSGRGEDLEVSHLLYADDALIFCEAESSQIRSDI